MSAKSPEVDGLFVFDTPVQLLHPNLLKARKFEKTVKGVKKESGEPKFGGLFMFSPEDASFKRAKSIAAAVAKQEWPGRALSELHFPFQNGTEMADRKLAESEKDSYAYARGQTLLKASSGIDYPPILGLYERGKGFVTLDRDDKEDMQLAAKRFFFGALVIGSMRFKTYDGVSQNPDGVTCYLSKIVAVGGGTVLGGGRDIGETFKGYVGAVSEDDPTKGLENIDDEIPF